MNEVEQGPIEENPERVEEIEGAHVLEPLDEYEQALLDICTDPSGMDQAEFFWEDLEQDHGRFRGWPYQFAWWRTMDTYQIDQCARSVGKSLSIKVRGFAFPFVHPGQEMVITAPELVHLSPITSLIEEEFYNTRVGREMMVKGRSGVTHRPFQMNFRNGARIIGRIPQRDGKGVKGIHPIWLELDEAQDYPHDGWTELTETLKRGFDGARWRSHGVTRGLRDDFFKYTSDDSPEGKDWTKHRFPAMYRPNWTAEERDEKIKRYGSYDDPDYRRNVLGEHGDATNPMFVLHRLMYCVDQDKTSEYNIDEYYSIKVQDEELQHAGGDIVSFLNFPASHKLYEGEGRRSKAQYWVGMDVGFTVDPTEILVWVEYRDKPKDEHSKLKLLSRVQLVRTNEGSQVEAMLEVFDFYRPTAFAMDAGGNGLPLFQRVQNAAKEQGGDYTRLLKAIKGYKFSQKLLVDFDDTVELDQFASTDELIKEAGIHREAKEYASDLLRSLVDQKRLVLPYDEELLAQFQGSTWRPAKSGEMNQYGKRIFSKGTDHILDASRFFALGWRQHAIEDLMQRETQKPVFSSFV